MNSPTGDAGAELFGPYEIFEQLGVGGMARVHRAKKRGIEGFQRVVALKRLLSHLAEDESFVKSFVREARLASYLQHANIIQIYDLGLVDRVYFIAMEFVRGRDLRKILKQTAYATGPMPVSMMLTLTRQLCDALDYAHNRSDDNGEPLGIVHRDISPSNLLVAADGHLKVIDFGIAKATTASLRTHSGRVKGKFAYMAPEAIRGKPLDHRSDIFSAGIVAHEMLTARPLFAASNEYDTLSKITRLPIEPPSRHNPDCPPDLDDIVLTALSRSPEERWQSAGAMLRALDTVARKLALQATNREVSEWVDWAFALPLQSQRVSHPALEPRAQASQPTLMSSAAPLDMHGVDAASIEMVWGSQAQAMDDEQPQSHDNHPVPSRPSASISTLYGVAPPPAAPPPRTSTVDVRADNVQAQNAQTQNAQAQSIQAAHRSRVQTPILAVPAASNRPELAHDTILDDRASFAGLDRDRKASNPAPRPGTRRSGVRTALWLIFFAALFAGAAAGGYYFMPGTLLGKDEDKGNDRGQPTSEQAPAATAAPPDAAIDASVDASVADAPGDAGAADASQQ